MRNLRVGLLAAFVAAAVTGTALLMNTGPIAEAQEKVVLKDHWRNHDGHWSYWHEADKRWYYTDGSHWYYHNGSAWQPYRFDKQFGREGFEHGEYRAPAEGAKIVVPGHGIYRPPVR